MKQDKYPIKEILEKLNITELNDMQMAALGATEKSDNVVLLSPTGSGKTLAFLLPVFLGLKENRKGIQSLIIAPSRELGLQIEKVFKAMGTAFKVNCFYGGHDVKTELNSLLQPPAVLIGTPGRLAEHIRKENFEVDTIHTLVLDEFDKSLEFGFEKDMEFIIGKLYNLHKRILTSATQSIDIPSYTGIVDPQEVSFLSEEAPKGLTLKLVRSPLNDKLDTLLALLAQIGNEPTLVFCNHRETVEQISKFLASKRWVHDVYHGKLEQYEREKAIAKFRNGSTRILVTTDLASRGLDIANMQNVVHFHIPATEEIYTHRNGRTARMDTEGQAYLIMSPEEYMPGYITSSPEELKLDYGIVNPQNPAWATIHITGGKKEKINKADIVGLFMKKGSLLKDELGILEVGDHHSYAAVKVGKAAKMVQLLGQEKIKGYRLKMEIV